MELPRYVQIEPVGQCNLRCRMCPILFRKDGPPYGPPAFMPFEDFTRLVDQFEAMAELHLQGLGEPMMHPRFFDMVRYAVQKNVRVTTNSNLTLLNERKAKLCVESGLNTLHVSIDGATRETYEHIRVRARWDRVFANLEALLRARSSAGVEHPQLRMVTVVMRRNLHELPDLVRLASRWCFEEIFVQQLSHDFGESTLPDDYRPMREFVDQETLLGEDLRRVTRYFEEARVAARDTGIRLRLPSTRLREHAPGTPGPQRCDWPWRRAYVSYQGYSMPCCMVSTPDRIHFGNMIEQGVRPVWSGETSEAFRRRLDSDNPPDVCRSCSIYRGTF